MPSALREETANNPELLELLVQIMGAAAWETRFVVCPDFRATIPKAKLHRLYAESSRTQRRADDAQA